MNVERKIDRVLTEYNFDRMTYEEAKQELLNLHSVSDIVRAFEEWQKKYPLVNLEDPEWQLKKFLSEYYC